MSNIFETSWGISKISLRVLRANRHFLAFPALSFATMAALFLAVVPILGESGAASSGLVFTGLYFLFIFIGVFFDAALTCEALRALRGQNTSVSAGLGCALTRAKPLAGYAGISATVGMVIGALGRSSHTGRWLTQKLLVTGWSLVTYLALPVLIAERRSAYDSVHRASLLFRDTWRETAVAEVGFRVLTIHMVALLLLLCALLSDVLNEPTLIVIAVLTAVALAVVLSALAAIYRAALYIFAAEGVVPDEFDTPEMHSVWRVK